MRFLRSLLLCVCLFQVGSAFAAYNTLTINGTSMEVSGNTCAAAMADWNSMPPFGLRMTACPAPYDSQPFPPGATTLQFVMSDGGTYTGTYQNNGGICQNGASDYPSCQVCPSGQNMVGGVCKAPEGVNWADSAHMLQAVFIGILALLFGVGVMAGQQR